MNEQCPGEYVRILRM